jgi:tRNA (cytidine/uridine-2'-O-)-methyltransferase
MRILLYQPDIPQNVGAIMRLCACFGVKLEVVEPCGFAWDERKIRRSGMDYIGNVDIVRHASWEAYRKQQATRLVLLTTKGEVPYHRFAFAPSDTLVLGRESAGVPESVHAACDARVIIPLAQGMRSLNVAQAAAIALAEGLRQTSGLQG